MTYRQDEVIALADEMIFVKIDAEKDTILANKYGVAGYPTIVFAGPDGAEIDRIWGYAEAPEYVSTIRDYQVDRNTLADYLRRIDTAATHELYYKIAEKYVGRKKFTDAETYYRKILQEDPANRRGYADSALYSMGKMKSRDKKYGAAEEIFNRFLKTYPESDLADNAMFKIADTRRRAEKYDEAIAGFKEFLQLYPESDLANDAELYIAYAHNQKGEKEEALRLYGKFLEAHPDSPDTSWVKEKIDEIENPPEEEEND